MLLAVRRAISRLTTPVDDADLIAEMRRSVAMPPMVIRPPPPYVDPGP